MNLNEISKQLPAKIKNHAGSLTITKRIKNGKYYCYYPFAVNKESESVPVIKGNSIESVVKKMHKKLIEKNIITKLKKVKKKKFKKKSKSKMTNKEKIKYRLKRQNSNLKNK